MWERNAIIYKIFLNLETVLISHHFTKHNKWEYDYILKGYLDKKDAERTGITTQIKEEKTLWEKVKDAIEVANGDNIAEDIEKRKKKRQEIDDMHYYGDIGDRK